MKLKKRKCANKDCGKMFYPRHRSTEKVCSFPCASAYARKIREDREAKEWRERKKEIKQSLKTKQDYEKEVQKVFNEFIRLRDRGKPCISCGSILTGKFDAGHFYPVGSYKNLRFDEENTHGQCVHCNQHKHGNLAEYSINLPKRIGIDKFISLQDRRNNERHYSIPELIELKVIYKDKARRLNI